MVSQGVFEEMIWHLFASKSRNGVVRMNVTEFAWTSEKDNELNRLVLQLKNTENRNQLLYLFDELSPRLTKEDITFVTNSRGDYWHGGVKNSFDFKLNKYIQPCWMLDLVPEIDQNFVSWKMDGSVAIIPLWLFDQVGYPSTQFSSVQTALMDWSFRAIRSGAIPMNSKLLRDVVPDKMSVMPFSDEIKFVKRNYASFWTKWALVRAMIKRQVSISCGLLAWRELGKSKFIPPVIIDRAKSKRIVENPSISVIIITLERYSYLSTTIGLLMDQMVKPFEIIIVDATIAAHRSLDWFDQFSDSDIPIRIIYSDIGQCTQRNKGVEIAKGDYIYFCDDDMDEIRPDHLLRHVFNIAAYQADASCGMPDEVGAFIKNRELIPLSVSDVFPTNDSLVNKTLLVKVGGFDIKMDRGQSEDHELGIRLFQAGALILLDPQIRALHIRASSGGLRKSNVRKITRASSHSNIFHFRLLHSTEFYLNLKHFPPQRVKELLNIVLIASLKSQYGWSVLLKAVFGLMMLPYHYIILRKRFFWAQNTLSKK